ncbi:hypothetical protein JQ596_15735 [Bradyrhizobium manausense]|nr:MULTISPECIES: hypothetical protein [Bradyrhizobium]MBR0826996.1 hypothetical protein [Bradyrhizobium manausense]UVO32279.1 hypothetical protein KUF59_17420 [Bradyrhizobium arachidis]
MVLLASSEGPENHLLIWRKASQRKVIFSLAGAVKLKEVYDFGGVK